MSFSLSFWWFIPFVKVPQIGNLIHNSIRETHYTKLSWYAKLPCNVPRLAIFISSFVSHEGLQTIKRNAMIINQDKCWAERLTMMQMREMNSVKSSSSWLTRMTSGIVVSITFERNKLWTLETNWIHGSLFEPHRSLIPSFRVQGCLWMHLNRKL